jgi:hypothetical protein
MSSRIASLSVTAFLSLGLLSGCPTRSVPSAAVDGATTSSPDVDANPDATTMNVALPDDAGADTADTQLVDAAIDSGSDTTSDQPKLPPPPLSDVGVSCTVNAQCVTGSCVDGVCCASAACGGCQSCAIPGSLGACSPLPKLTEDPRSSCVGTMACDGAGHCAEANGNTCQATADCLSGFCVDGVCCETACDQQCFSCNTAFELRGMCRPFTSGTDLNASVPCGGSSSCALGPTPDQPVCLLDDGQPCTTAAECVSGQCSTFYADADGDKYGNADRSVTICGAADAPPASFVVVAGDCCDADGDAHPNQSEFFSHPDACGSFDYNCDGYDQKEFTTGSCGGQPGGAACGKTCLAEVLMSPVVLYTQACR